MPARNPVVWIGLWSSEHNNIRLAELLPRLANVDKYYVHTSRNRLIRGIQRRLVKLHYFKSPLGRLSNKYQVMLCSDPDYAAMFDGDCFVDMDDPSYDEASLEKLASPRIVKIIASSEDIKDRYRACGLQTPIEVVPQGVAWSGFDPEKSRRLREALRQDPDELVVGLHQPMFLLQSECTTANMADYYSIDTLIEAMTRLRQSVPQACLWLVGRASAEVARLAQEQPWLRLIGYQPHARMLDYVGAFDVGVYPRSGDAQASASIKILEYQAAGIPVVGMPVQEMQVVGRTGSGLIAANFDELPVMLGELLTDEDRRRQLGAAGHEWAKRFDYDVLAGQYMALLDEYTGRHD